MNGEMILEVVNKLTGVCYPYGDTSIDEDRYESLLMKTEVVAGLLWEIIEAGKLYNRHEYSILKISNKANEFLVDWREILNEIEYLPPLEDIRGEE